MNWGTLILGIIIGAVVVGVIWFAYKPATTEGQLGQGSICEARNNIPNDVYCQSPKLLELLTNAGCPPLNILCAQ